MSESDACRRLILTSLEVCYEIQCYIYLITIDTYHRFSNEAKSYDDI